jgi:flagellar basal body rod protein FlgG
MIKGLYAAASAMLFNAARQQTISHNIANLQTPGFKQILSAAQDFLPGRAAYSSDLTSQAQTVSYLGALGLGVQPAADWVDYAQGALQQTDNPLDFALQGENAFFRLQTPNGERYTRDGRFQRDAENTLVSIDGYPVLDDAGQPITLPAGEVSLTSQGALLLEGEPLATLGIGVFQTPSTELQHTEGNLFTGPAASTAEDPPQVVQGWLETSNANPSQLMTQLVEVARSYEAAQKLVQNQDELTGKTIASLGRIG